MATKRREYQTPAEIFAAAKKVRRQISRLWNTYTSVDGIRELNRLLEIATENELRWLEERYANSN
jgi:cell division protein FtsL